MIISNFRLEFHTGVSCCDKRLSTTNLPFTQTLKSEVSSLLLRFVSPPSWPPSFLLHQGETAKCRNAWETLEKMLPTKQQNEVKAAMQPGGTALGLLFCKTGEEEGKEAKEVHMLPYNFILKYHTILLGKFGLCSEGGKWKADK